MDDYFTRLLYRTALDRWGKEAQIRMVFEEMSELQKELCKRMRGADNLEAIAEEIADVRIMLEQMGQMFDCESYCEIYRGEKLLRLAKTLCADELTKDEKVTYSDRAQSLMAFVKREYCRLLELPQDEVEVRLDADGNFVIGCHPKAEAKTVAMTVEYGEPEEGLGDA